MWSMKTDCDKLKIYPINTKDTTKITTKKNRVSKTTKEIKWNHTDIQSLQWRQKKKGKEHKEQKRQTTR